MKVAQTIIDELQKFRNVIQARSEAVTNLNLNSARSRTEAESLSRVEASSPSDTASSELTGILDKVIKYVERNASSVSETANELLTQLALSANQVLQKDSSLSKSMSSSDEKFETLGVRDWLERTAADFKKSFAQRMHYKLLDRANFLSSGKAPAMAA